LTLTTTSSTQQTATTEMAMTKKSVNDRADKVDAVEGDDSNTGDITTLDVVLFFFNLRKHLTILFFVGVLNIISLVLAMFSPRNECWAVTV
jgi:hypothetical protein